MSPKRLVGPPPRIEGFTYQSVLGSGGFADVFLYQDVLGRRVAVKVLLVERLSSGSEQQFTAEANLMAALSAHPSIVTIYQAGLSSDGRPYLVMEYFPKANLQVRYRRERFSAAEALRIGIQVAGAVETSHRAGILHRDIKPANILISEYNKPALTDFGISATQENQQDAVGMSIPWSPPESFGSPPWSGPQSDVYALAATVYTLLAGRSPFEVPGAANSSSDILGRIENSALPALGRDDVPPMLEEALAKAMSKSPGDRYETSLAFARALQKVQIDMHMAVTPVDVVDDSADQIDENDDDDGLTRIRSIVSISPEATAPQAPSRGRHPDYVQPIAGVPDDTVLRDGLHASGGGQPAGRHEAGLPLPVAPPIEDTLLRPPSEPPSSEVSQPAKRRMLVPTIIGAAAVIVVGGAIAATLMTGQAGEADKKGAGQSAPQTSVPLDPVVESIVPAPTGLAGTVGDKGVVFSWQNPSPQPEDMYLWRVLDAETDGPLTSTKDPSVSVQPGATGRTCIEVSIRRSTGRSTNEPAVACAP
ncbi:serine/threonine-protein kinase [Arthrobacter sp. MDT3-24]